MAFLAALSRRERIPELMDDPGLDPREHRRALAGLARINRFSGSIAVLWKPVLRFAREHPAKPLRLLDVATGSGDVPIGLWQKAKAAGIPLSVEGCDISPTAIESARSNAEAAGTRANFFDHDVLGEPLPGGFDIVTCSLFLHHLGSDDALTLLKRMAAAGSLVLVNDLARSRFIFLAVWLACHGLSASPVVRYDGPASVRSAFSPSEARSSAEQAGLNGASVRRRFPCRFLLEWRKP
ncbi:MAG TPA: methyltransferase domain-containing protein [Urbifossiella sp.]|nr:methyltransferase domain-containing protein [Urbifossiella sp.]